MATNVVGNATDLSTIGTLTGNDIILDRGNQNITGGLTTGTSAANFLWGESATPVIKGTDGSALSLKITTNFLIKGPGGVLFWAPVATSAKLQNIGATRVSLGTGTLTNCENGGQGDMTIGENTVVTNLRVTGGAVSEAYNATANTIVTVGGGSLVSQRAFTTGYLGVGSWTWGRPDLTIDASQTGITGGTLYAGGGEFIGQGCLGNITAIHAWGDAFLDFREVTKAFTLATLTVTKEVRDRSYFKSKYVTITITSTTVYGSEIQTVLQ